jgi:restriction system protein
MEGVHKMTLWMVKAGEHAFLIDDFKNKNIIAIGPNYIGDFSKFQTREEIKNKIKKIKPEYNRQKIGHLANIIFTFIHNFSIGDLVITYVPNKREYLIGKIKSDNEFKPKLCEYQNVREVMWIGKINRDKLSTMTKHKLGAIQTLFRVHDAAAKEILNFIEVKKR